MVSPEFLLDQKLVNGFPRPRSSGRSGWLLRGGQGVDQADGGKLLNGVKMYLFTLYLVFVELTLISQVLQGRPVSTAFNIGNR